MVENLGELAALATAALWALSSIFFARAGERVGSMVVNIVRLAMALLFLAALSWIRRGDPFPSDAPPGAWLWLSASGLVGFVFGDMCLFRAYLLIGARLSMLVMVAAPAFTALAGWILLGEILGDLEWLGMFLTGAGIVWAIAGRTPTSAVRRDPRDRRRGVLLALGGALGQAVGLVLSKEGMGAYNAFAATEIRVIAALGGWILVLTASGWWPRVRSAWRDGVGMAYIAAGALVGPFLGVSLSLLAVQHTRAGVAASIMATTPLLVIPLTRWLERESISASALGGAAVAVAGVVLLFM